MSGMRALQKLNVGNNLLRGCLSLPAAFMNQANQCTVDGNNFCCALEQYNCYEGKCLTDPDPLSQIY
jgi:hypothetical protein